MAAADSKGFFPGRNCASSAEEACIGEGRFGKVYRRRDENNTDIAVKVIKATNGTEEDKRIAKENAQREKHAHQQIMEKKIRHRNLVAIYAVTGMINTAIKIVMELGSLGNLDEYFRLNVQLCDNSMESFFSKLRLMKDMINGVSYLHSQHVAHRDLKPDNVVLTQGPNATVIAKLCDFGLAKILDPNEYDSDPEMTSEVGGIFFRAPEFFKDDVRYNLKCDVYSLGLIFTAMIQALHGSSLIPAAEGFPVGCLTIIGKEAIKHPEKHVILDRQGDLNEMRFLKQIIRGMLQVSPNDRLSAVAAQTQIDSLLNQEFP